MDHYLVKAKIRERLAVNKQGSHKFHIERFNLKKLNEVESKEKYRVEVSNRTQYKNTTTQYKNTTINDTTTANT
jgi:hypothetical protein